MRAPPWIALVLAACMPRSAPAPEAPPPIAVGDVVVSRIAPDVYAAIRSEPLGLAVNANSLFIVDDSDVVVVDAQFTRKATLENIAALRRITRKPVRYVINTHWHDDHVAGNQVYRDSFPGVQFLAHANTRADLVRLGRPNRAQQLQFMPGALDRFERLVHMGLGGDSTRATPTERASLISAVQIARQYVAESNGFREVLPDTIAGRQMTLRRGGRTIELHWFGRGNTRGDLVTYLPAERVLATGDLVVAPIPFAFGSYPTEWIGVLDSIVALNPRVLVPGHGPIMHDLSYVTTIRRMLSGAREQVLAASTRGASEDSVVKLVTLDDYRVELAGDEKWMRTMFDMFFRRPVISRVLEESKHSPLP